MRAGQHSSQERGQRQGSGILRDGGGVTWSPRLVEGKYTDDVGFREHAAERKLWKVGLEQWLSNLSVAQRAG